MSHEKYTENKNNTDLRNVSFEKTSSWFCCEIIIFFLAREQRINNSFLWIVFFSKKFKLKTTNKSFQVNKTVYDIADV